MHKPKPVIGVCIATGERVRFASAREAQRVGGFNNRKISDVCLYKADTHKGHTWTFENEEDN